MNTTRYWLTICAMSLVIAALWFYNGQQAKADSLSYYMVGNNDTVVKSTITDNSQYPEIVARLSCSGSDVSDMIEQCRIALHTLCPDGGIVSDLGETGPGVLPAQIAMTLKCRHEPAGA